MQLTTQSARPALPAYDPHETRENRTENDSTKSKGIAVESGIFVEGMVEGNSHCFILASWGDLRKKDQENFRSKPVD